MSVSFFGTLRALSIHPSNLDVHFKSWRRPNGRRYVYEPDGHDSLAKCMLGPRYLSRSPPNSIVSISLSESSNYIHKIAAHGRGLTCQAQYLNSCLQYKGRGLAKNSWSIPWSRFATRFTSIINSYLLLGLICLPLVECSGDPNNPFKQPTSGTTQASSSHHLQKLSLQCLGLGAMGFSTYRLLKFGIFRTEQEVEGRARLKIWQIFPWLIFWFSTATCCYKQLPKEALYRQHLLLLAGIVGALILGHLWGSEIDHLLLVELPLCIYISIVLGCLWEILSKQ